MASSLSKAKPGYILFSAFVLALAIFAAYTLLPRREKPCLVLLSGSGMKAPVAEIVDNFEKETGIKVYTFFEGSAILRDYIINFSRGDLFLSGDRKNLDIVSKKGYVKEGSLVAWHTAAILISPQYKEKIKGLDDLAGKGVRLAISNPKMTSLGKRVMESIIERHPKGREILKNIVVYGSSCEDVLNLYGKGGIDAVIEWDTMVFTPGGKGLSVVRIEDAYQAKDTVNIGLLNTAANPALAKRFYDYFTTEGKEVFRKHGYHIEG